MDSLDSGSVAALMAFLSSYLLIIIILLVVQIIGSWKVYTKAGRPGWASIIPIYNQYVLFEIVGMKGWYAFLTFIPFVGTFILAILSFIAYYKLAICFGKDTGFGIGLILLPFIFQLILAFGDAKYTKPEAAN